MNAYKRWCVYYTGSYVYMVNVKVIAYYVDASICLSLIAEWI